MSLLLHCHPCDEEGAAGGRETPHPGPLHVKCPFQNRYSEAAQGGEGQGIFLAGSGPPDMARAAPSMRKSWVRGPGLRRTGRGRRAFTGEPAVPGRGQSGLSGQTAWQAPPTDNSRTHFLVPRRLGRSAQLVRPSPQLPCGSAPRLPLPALRPPLPRCSPSPPAAAVPEPRQVTLQGDHFLIRRLHYFIHYPPLPRPPQGPRRTLYPGTDRRGGGTPPGVHP